MTSFDVISVGRNARFGAAMYDMDDEAAAFRGAALQELQRRIFQEVDCHGEDAAMMAIAAGVAALARAEGVARTAEILRRLAGDMPIMWSHIVMKGGSSYAV